MLENFLPWFTSHILQSWGTMAIFLVGAVLGGFTNGLAGFAFSAMAGALFLAVLPATVAIPLMSAMTVCLHICNNVHYFKKIEWRKMFVYFIPGFIGVPLGHWLLQELSRPIVAGIFGIVLLVYAGWMMFKKPNPENNFGGRIGEVCLGFLGGLAAGLLSQPGTPAVIWCNIRGYSKEKTRAFTVPFNLVMLIANLVVTAVSAKHGKGADPAMAMFWPMFIAGFLAIFIGWFAGIKSFGIMKEIMFRRFVLFVFIVSGIGLLIPGVKLLMNKNHAPVAATATVHSAPALNASSVAVHN